MSLRRAPQRNVVDVTGVEGHERVTHSLSSVLKGDFRKYLVCLDGPESGTALLEDDNFGDAGSASHILDDGITVGVSQELREFSTLEVAIQERAEREERSWPTDSRITQQEQFS